MNVPTFFKEQGHYSKIFIEHNGLGPWLCFFCSEEIIPDEKPRSRYSLAVHHKNHNHDDNRKSNLKSSHWSCHSQHHALNRSSEHLARMSEAAKGNQHGKGKGKPKSADHIAKLSIASMGHVVTPETREKLRVAATGKVLTLETRAKMSESQRRRREVA